MVFAQIKDQLVVNTIIIDDESMIDLFSNDPVTEQPYDLILRIDYIYPRPGIGWVFDGIIFIPPAEPEIIEEI